MPPIQFLPCVAQLPSGFLRPVDDRVDFIPVRNTQAGAGQPASLPARLSGTRYRFSAWAAGAASARKLCGGRSITAIGTSKAIAPPVLPAVKLREIVSAHDPDEAQAGTAAAQIADGVRSVARSDDGFETADIDPRIVGHFARGLSAFLQLVQAAIILKRIARRHQPPDAVEFQPLDRELADGAMRGMGRVERAAEQADAHSIGVKRNFMRG